MRNADSNRFVVSAVVLVLMMLIAGTFGYRLQISPSGLTFERTLTKN